MADVRFRADFVCSTPESGRGSSGSRESVVDPGCSLTRGLDVKLSVDAPVGFTVLSAVGAKPSA